ncbi:putative Twitching motility protein PilH [Gammaproteobacteria bacterium]
MARNILLVDDSKSARYAIGVLLRKHGCEVEEAASGEQALEMLQKRRPDAIFLDQQLPGMAGLDLLVALRSEHRNANLPVIMCSSNEEAEFVRMAREKGAFDVLAKPDAPKRIGPILERLSDTLNAPAAGYTSTTRIETGRPAAAPSATTLDLDELKRVIKLELDLALAGAIQANFDPLITRRLQDFQEIIRPTIERYATESLAHEMAVQGHVMRDEIMKTSTQHIQRAAEDLINHTIPRVVKQYIEAEAKKLSERTLTEFNALANKVLKEIPHDASIVRHVVETAQAAAERKGIEVSRREAEVVANRVATDKANSITSITTDQVEAALAKMKQMAIMAAGISVAASALVFFLK